MGLEADTVTRMGCILLDISSYLLPHSVLALTEAQRSDLSPADVEQRYSSGEPQFLTDTVMNYV